MKKNLLLLLCFIAGLTSSVAQGIDDTKWYLVQFVNGGNAITASANGAQITTSAATGNEAQLWRILGDNTNGYTFTNKLGYTLYVGSAAKDQMVHASTSATGVTKFKIMSASSGYEIRPVGNTGVAMNLWGGPSENRGVGLWTSGDQNNPVTFVDATSFEELGKISIIPTPREISVKEGEFNLTTLNAIAYTGERMEQHARAFAAQLKKSAGIELAVKEAGESAQPGEIWFGTNETLGLDAYTLAVTGNSIEINASGFGGWFYGLQTLIQLLPREYFASELCSITEWNIPIVEINDEPLLGHRGYMLDIARHFFNKEEVMKVLDMLAFYKLNRFHWHLTDDQGWRVEIPEYPKLTEVGAIRSRSFSNIGDGQSFYDDTEYGRGMYYTQDELREVVEYAKARNIEIIPEIDLPGHMVAAVTSYPELSCDPTKQYQVRVDSGISEDVLNIGNDNVIEFLKCVLDNIAGIFPYEYIHIGGDECPTGQWSSNQQCLDRVKALGLDGVHQLQSWLVEELGIYLKENHGKDIVVWDELLSNWNDSNRTKPIIMAWNGIGLSGQAANRGMKSIIVPHSHLYLDFMQSDENNRFVDELYHGGWGINTVEEIYSLNPLSSLQGREEYALGVQGNMWTETCNDIDEVEYQLLPRLLALAEIGWLPESQKSWPGFYKRLQSHDEIFELLDYKYAKHYIEPTEYTNAEKALMEAEEILAASTPGCVGYPTAEAYNALHAAYTSAKENEDAISQLTAAIEEYKNAPICQPIEGKTYQVVSASTYYKRQYEGSTMYQKGDGVRFHYTPQVEPEELWQFTASGNGYIMTNLYSGKQITMAGYNSAIKMSDSGTAVRIDKATIATQNFTYIPGAVTISATEGYSASMTGNVKRLSAEGSGEVYAKDEAALCYNGTWKFVEVTNFKAQLQGLVKKCDIILLTAKPGEMNQYTQEALDYLQNSVITPANEALENNEVTEAQYNAFVALYHQFQMMERTGIAQSLSEDYYYYIYNVWFGKYAAYNKTNSNISPRAKGTGDEFLWSIIKKPNGQVYIYNKATGTAAYLSASGDGQAVKMGEEYAWMLEERTLDGKTGICIIDNSGSYSWYTNPDAWNYLLMKPFWGACTWEFQKSSKQVATSVIEIESEAKGTNAIYDLRGNRVSRITSPGIYMINGEKVVVPQNMIE